MAITITDFAKEKLYSLLKRTGSDDLFLRIALKSGGCSGFSYCFDYIGNPEKSDKIFIFDKLKICVDLKSYIFLNGMEIDYEETIFKSGIVLNNPNAKRSCGCGESISF